MILRNPREGSQGYAPEDIFEAVEPRSGAVIGRCCVAEEIRPLMFPDRPYQIRLDIEGDEDTLDTREYRNGRDHAGAAAADQKESRGRASRCDRR